MAHSYTPGLRVADSTVLLRERRLPLRGTVLVGKGDRVEADQVVARCELPGGVQTVNVASGLGIDPAAVPEALTRSLGSAVRSGQVVAAGRSLFGLVRRSVTAPTEGVIESVSSITGQVILREPPIPVEITAYVRGRVQEVLPDEGVVIEARGALVQGIFGVGQEAWGPVAVAVEAATHELTRDRLHEAHRGCVVVGGSYVSHATLMHARDQGVVAVVVGGFDDHDLRLLLGRDLGVAITGSEDLGITLILTEGFGRIGMADRTWSLLRRHDGRQASVSGATQIRAGVMRPEILIPHDTGAEAAGAAPGRGLEVGSLVRGIRQPHFGRIAHVVEVPSELRELESEARVRVVVVRFTDDETRAVIPRANVELIAE